MQETAARSIRRTGASGFLHDPGDGQVLHLLRLAGVRRRRTRLPRWSRSISTASTGSKAVERLLKSLLGRAVPPDARLTKQQRRRARHMLQAVDGRMNGATYREIAGVIYGVSRVASDPWKSSALRGLRPWTLSRMPSP